MLCPNCGKNIPGGATVCHVCGYRVEQTESAKAKPKTRKRLISLRAPAPVKAAIWILGALLFLCVLSVGIYKGYYWLKAARLERFYDAKNETEPMVDEFTFSDGRAGHALTFYGTDGDLVYIEQLRRSFMIVAGVARVEVADSEWFSESPEDVDSAEIVITPVRISPNGARTRLPAINLTVEVPYSPLILVAPEGGFEEIYASNYVLKAKVVPGSRVLVDGVDVTDLVDIFGELTVNVAVYPQNENIISMVVETSHHRQTRRDVIIYRQAFDIPMEITTAFAESTTRETFTVEGATEAGAQIVVDTPYVEDSIQVDADGKFSFVAKFDKYGDNTVIFRAVKEGRQDSAISFTIRYTPSLAEYSKNAWKMNYDELIKCTDVWAGRVFLCRGYYVDTASVSDPQVFIYNVATLEEPKYVALENMSATTTLTRGTSYDAYADVKGLYDWDGTYIPYLTVRYFKVTE